MFSKDRTDKILSPMRSSSNRSMEKEASVAKVDTKAAGAWRCVLVVTTAAMFCSMFHPGVSETERSPANRVGLTHCENFAIRGDRYRFL